MGKLTPMSPASKRGREVLRRLKRVFPGAGTALGYANTLELLISVILSAQCTDKKVNEVTSSLFLKYHTVEDYANADPKEFEKVIHSTGFYRAKTRHIIATAKMLISDFGGEIPQSMEELIRLPGVARKTANIVLGHGFGIVEGIAVDTHVFRVSRRLGLVNPESKDPNTVERELMNIIPVSDWQLYSDIVILHGRETCNAKKAKCDLCILVDLCISAGNV